MKNGLAPALLRVHCDGSHGLLGPPLTHALLAGLLLPSYSCATSELAPILPSIHTLSMGDTILSPALSTRYTSTLHTKLNSCLQANLFLIFRRFYQSYCRTAPWDDQQVTQTHKTNSWFSSPLFFFQPSPSQTVVPQG